MRFSRLLVVCFLLLMVSMARGSEPLANGPSPKDKCPVCGMFVAKYPDFIATIGFQDGSRFFFDGAKDMFKYYFNIQKYNPDKNQSDIDDIFVTDYYSMALVDARAAFYVIGSDIYGPMGRELIPFTKEMDAEVFMKDHAGKTLLKFENVTLSIVKDLD